jgi:hypothetical protein
MQYPKKRFPQKAGPAAIGMPRNFIGGGMVEALN